MFLGGTKAGRDIHEEIQGGYIDKMSFQFRVAEETYNRETHTWHITKIKKVYDVSAVSIPAYDTTSISARNRQEHYKKEETEKEKLKMLLDL